MINNIKRVSLIALSLSIGLMSCAPPTLEQQNQENLIKQIRDNTLSIATTDRGSISGSLTTVNNASTANQDIKIQVIREVDIPKTDANGNNLDITGKVFTDSKTQTQAFVEKKGDVIATEIIRNTNRFLITNLRPGSITVVTNVNNEQLESRAVVVAGRVTPITNIAVGSTIRDIRRTSLNITGKVIRLDGTPVANAKVSDIVSGFINNSVTTNSQGEFSLPTNPFTGSKNLEVSFGDQVTSVSVNPDGIENINITLLNNSRTVTGTVYNSVIKERPVSGIIVRVDGQNISTTTDANGKFNLRGVQNSQITLQIGETKGYINTKSLVQPSQSNSTDIGSVFIRPIGNVSFNLVAESSPLILTDGQRRILSRSRGSYSLGSDEKFSYNDDNGFPIQGNPGSYGREQTLSNDYTYEYRNGIVFDESLTGTIQFEGTDIIKEFIYPITPKRIIKIIARTVGADGIVTETTTDKELYTQNQIVSVPINDIPGGEYSVSVTLPFHQTQKGIRLIVPSNDTISSELVQMRLVQSVSSIGDITGKVIIKDSSGNILPIPAGSELRVAVLGSSEENLSTSRVQTLLTGSGQTIALSRANSDGSYVLQNVPTGTKIILAGIITENVLDARFMPNSYVLLNVNSGQINQAPEMTIIRRAQ